MNRRLFSGIPRCPQILFESRGKFKSNNQQMGPFIIRGVAYHINLIQSIDENKLRLKGPLSLRCVVILRIRGFVLRGVR